MLQHIHLFFFHKYHRTPHVVTGFITNSDKNLCENKHLVNIQLSDDFLHSNKKLSSHVTGLFFIWRLKRHSTFIEKSHSRTSIYQSGRPSDNICAEILQFLTTKLLWYKWTLQPVIVYSSQTGSRFILLKKIYKYFMKVLYSAALSERSRLNHRELIVGGKVTFIK